MTATLGDQRLRCGRGERHSTQVGYLCTCPFILDREDCRRSPSLTSAPFSMNLSSWPCAAEPVIDPPHILVQETHRGAKVCNVVGPVLRTNSNRQPPLPLHAASSTLLRRTNNLDIVSQNQPTRTQVIVLDLGRRPRLRFRPGYRCSVAPATRLSQVPSNSLHIS